MRFRRVLLTALAALGAVAAAPPAQAAPPPRYHRPISAITLTPEGTGTLIRITIEGSARTRTRLLRSRDPIDALAVADVDNDGDLDILAGRAGGGLVLWRNTGRGGFIVAAAPARVGVTRRETGIRSVPDSNAPIQSGLERFGVAMTRAPDAGADPLETPHVARASSLVLSACTACPPGRAPPPAIA